VIFYVSGFSVFFQKKCYKTDKQNIRVIPNLEVGGNAIAFPKPVAGIVLQAGTRNGNGTAANKLVTVCRRCH
jgi:hypothetical protein